MPLLCGYELLVSVHLTLYQYIAILFLLVSCLYFVVMLKSIYSFRIDVVYIEGPVCTYLLEIVLSSCHV